MIPVGTSWGFPQPRSTLWVQAGSQIYPGLGFKQVDVTRSEKGTGIEDHVREGLRSWPVAFSVRENKGTRRLRVRKVDISNGPSGVKRPLELKE